MKIIRTEGKNDSSWANSIVEAGTKKFSSLSVSAGQVTCPLTNGIVPTLNCEICNYCQGVDFNLETSMESIKCAHKESANVKTAQVDEVERLYVSEKANEKEEGTILPEDLKSIFAKSTAKFDDIEDADLMNASKIVSAKNLSENESDGTSGFVPKYSNSIFDSEAIVKLEEAQKAEDDERDERIKQAQVDKAKSKREWEDDTQSELKEIGYQHKGSIMSIAHEAKANNPEVSEYKFSIFDSADERLRNLPELTKGEQLKDQAKERKENISRPQETDDWESKHADTISTSKIVSSFFDDMLGE